MALPQTEEPVTPAELQARFTALTNQRNDALNEVAVLWARSQVLEAQLKSAKLKIASLEEKVADTGEKGRPEA